MRVSDVMIEKDLPMNSETDTFRDALSKMTKGRQGVTIIVNYEKKCVGILTDGDIRRTFEKYDRVSEIKLKNIYTRNPKTIFQESLAVEALKIMQDNKITSLVVLNRNQKIVGLIHIHHLIEQGFI
jgi:arabinose-5-phosphate isomerase